MNTLGISLLWCVLQATLFTSLGLVVYLALRRRSPAAAATAVASTLVVLAVVSALAFSPWPRWYTFGREMPATRAGATWPDGSNVSADRNAPATRTGPTGGDANQPATRAGATGRVHPWQFFWDELQRTPVIDGNETAAWRWPGIVATLFLCGVCLALGRIVLGLLAVHRYRAGMTQVNDPKLLAQAAAISRQMDCRSPVELRQSASLHTPATIGWRRPIVILPADWPAWTATERQVVLAHEIAHIARGDYAAWLLAQLSVALHFYHPLVHWLARRLRLEQELAADAWAASMAGSRENYLMTLAQMALRQDDHAIAWAARGFLPTRGAFLRRIEMLRENKPLQTAPLSRRRAAVLMAVVALAGLAIAGVRAPGAGTAVAQAAPPAKATTAERAAAAADRNQSFDLSYVPSRAVAVLAVRPAEILTQPGMQSLAKLLNEGTGLEESTGLMAEKVAEAELVITRLPKPDSGRQERLMDSALTILRYTEAIDWKNKVGANLVGKPVEATVAGKTYYHSDHGDAAIRPAFYAPDDRTIVFGPEIDVQRAILSAGKSRPDWADRWENTATGQAAAMVDLMAVNRIGELRRAPPAGPLFAPLWEQGQRLFVSAQLGNKLNVGAQIDCANEQDAKRVQETIQAALTLARNGLDDADRQLARGPANQAAAALMLIDLAEDVLKHGKLQTDGATVEYVTQADLAAESFIVAVAPAVMAARASASRAQSTNNMKHIMLAVHNYIDVNKHFPPPMVMGPDGKTPHSWRIEILPYLEQEPLYRQYKMDEPWDSENNKKVLEQMPAVLRDPQADPNSKETSYFALVGSTTLFGAQDSKGTTFADIKDGTSNTIAIVEAKRSVPWTKPEDIEYDADKPLPKLGGWRPGGFIAGFGDGSVHFLQDGIHEKMIRALITRAGGELINLESAP